MARSTPLAFVTFALLASAGLANAQTSSAPDPHRPATGAAPGMPMVPTAGAPAAGGPGAMPIMDMGKMVPGGDGQMPPMMQMMRGNQMMPGMMQFQHIEGRIAFLKAELAITDAQLPQWNAFADVLRANAKGMREGMTKMMQAGMPTTAPARAEAMVQMMTMHLEDMKSVASVGKALYLVLTDAQKKIADEMMSGPMGRV
jgi:hypothetical protein